MDDDPVILAFLRASLQREGYGCRTAPGVAAAIEMIAERTPAAILTDLEMGARSGVDLLLEVGRRPECAAVGLVLMSGRPLETARLALAAAKLSPEVLAKPFLLEDLWRALAKALRGRKPDTG